MKVPLDRILPNPEQPRKNFDQVEMENLVQSIVENGVITPICVEEAGDQYILIDGERRWRAAKTAGITEIPAEVRPPMNGTGKRERLVLALVANMQRSDMNPVEQARAFKALTDIGLSYIDIGRRLGISYATVSSHLRILSLDNEIQEIIARGDLAHDQRIVDAFLTIKNKTARVKLATRLAGRGKATIKSIVSACDKLNTLLDGNKRISTDEANGVQVARTKTGPKAGSPLRWNALKQIGLVPPWDCVINATQNSCKLCGLYDVASPKVCEECPLVTMLTSLMEMAK